MMEPTPQQPQPSETKKVSKLRKKAWLTLAVCALLVVLCAAGGIRFKMQADAKAAAAAEAARVAAEQAAAAEQAEADRLAAEQEAAALAAAEEERLAAEAASQAEAERQAKQQEAIAAKQNISYGSRVGTVWVEGTNVNCALYWGDSMSIMDAGAGCSADNGCVMPGENGTVFIGAHTGSYFADLKSTQMGAIIHLDTLWGDFRYQVTDLQVIYDTQVELCRWGDTSPNCILYTCYPFGILTPTNQRYLVYAEPLETDENGVVAAENAEND